MRNNPCHPSISVLDVSPDIVPEVVAIELACGLSSRGEQGLLRALDTPGFISLIATLSPQHHVGVFSGLVVLDELQIDNIAVIHQTRQSGIASLLLAHGISRARLLGATIAFLEVRSANLPAINLYRKAGFEVIGQRPAYYVNPGDDALLMSLHL